MVNANTIQKLREATGAGVMDCKKALDDSAGNFDDAIRIIKDRGFAKAEKREGRETGAGLLEAYTHNERIGVLLELRSETDFVARSEPMRALSHKLVMQVAAMDPADVNGLLEQPFIQDESRKVRDLVNEVIAQTGENIKIGRFARYEI
ncbi:MAG: translation elongation factor Ts [bacterium]|nr:translation elongation factor Ts [bacterium]